MQTQTVFSLVALFVAVLVPILGYIYKRRVEILHARGRPMLTSGFLNLDNSFNFSFAQAASTSAGLSGIWTFKIPDGVYNFNSTKDLGAVTFETGMRVGMGSGALPS